MSDTLLCMVELALDRHVFVRRGKKLEYFTIAWNSIEGIVAVVAGMLARSISLVGFGVDSFIEVTSGVALLWRLSVDPEEHRRERIERITLRIVGICFLLLAVYVGYEAASNLIHKEAPEHSLPGIILACVSLVVMPLLSSAKRRVGAHLKSAAMKADAKQTEFCTYLSAILLGGLVLNMVSDLWWADPVAALIMVPIIAKEGVDGLRAKVCCD
jgi:divalent metal cation (Fe/Co/Zn/Cd) transporter